MVEQADTGTVRAALAEAIQQANNGEVVAIALVVVKSEGKVDVTYGNKENETMAGLKLFAGVEKLKNTLFERLVLGRR